MKRRTFLEQSALLSTGILASASTRSAFGGIQKDTLRVGFVGVGVKGSSHVGCLLHMDDVELVAVCDVVEQQCIETQKQAERLGKPAPTAYFEGERDFVRMCESEDLDVVFTATPWRWHTEVCLTAMKNGSHAATELPAMQTIEEAWQLIEMCESTGHHLAMLENTNYQRPEMTILKMVREGLLGELVHSEGSYLHDTRYLKAQDHGDGLWLGDHHAKRNGNLYPTHGVGPIAWYQNINCGDRFDHLISMSSNARGMDLYASEHLPEGHPKRERRYINGDVNTCLIKTTLGRTLTVKHDTDLPRPYSRVNLVQGTRGIVRGYPEFKVCLEGEGIGDHHKWEVGAPFLESHKHPLWAKVDNGEVGPSGDEHPPGPITKGGVWKYEGKKAIRGGDFLEDYRVVQCLKNGEKPDIDVYDAATWSAIAPLSEASVANRSAVIDFPDFTKGKWQTREPVQILGV